MKNNNIKNKELIHESSNNRKNYNNKHALSQKINFKIIHKSNESNSLKNKIMDLTISDKNSNSINNNDQLNTYRNNTFNNRFFTNNDINSATVNLKVAIRIRPPLSRELEKNVHFHSIAIVDKENNSCSLLEYLGSEFDEIDIGKEWITNPQMFQIHQFTLIKFLILILIKKKYILFLQNQQLIVS